MRKNTARKWVHLLLDLLPVLIIPIFAIYTINHDPQNLQVDTEEYVQVDFNQLNEVAPSEYTIYGYRANSTWTDPLSYYRIQSVDFSQRLGHIFIGFTEINESTLSLNFTANNIDINSRFTLTSTILSGRTYLQLAFSRRSISYNYTGSVSASVSLFDLTQMFGSGNEPTTEQFWQLFEQRYYDYTLSEPMLINVGTISNTNTDIGSQFIYSMYIPVRDYFNMTNLFNFGDIYTWINNSMFRGSAPMPIFIVYNVIVYEFLIDLIFLIYSIFMFIIDFSSELLARCFSFSNKGGTR